MTGAAGGSPADFGDDALLDLLGRALAAADPVPPSVLDQARGAQAWASIDTDLAGLAELVFDSALALAGTRSESGQRELTFQAEHGEIEVLVTDDPRPSLEGQLVPAAEGQIVLESAGPSLSARVDQLGRFRFPEVPAGPVRFVARVGQARMRTSWILLRSS